MAGKIKQLTQTLRPDAAALDYTYNPGGQLTQLIIPRGNIGYTYDAQSGYIASVTAPGGVGLSYTYDGTLLLSETWTGPVAGTVSRQYDNDLRIIERTVDGTAITFSYDDDSLLTQAGALALTRNPLNSLLTGTTLATTTTSQSYNGFGELASYTAQHGGSTLYDVTYTRDNLGRITQKGETIQGATTSFEYTYDIEGRLFEVRENGVLTASYAYDSNGNRLARTTTAGTETGTYDAQDRLTNYDGTIYSYTASGELSTSNQSGAITQYIYDALGNLISVTMPDTTQIDYVIDGANRRIGKKVNGILVQGFLYKDQLNPIAEMDGMGSVISSFVYAEKANVPAYMVKGGVTYRIVSDHLGSPRLVINTQDGSIVQRMNFDDFGQVVLDTNPGFQPFGYAGGIYDLHTGLVRFGARDYDSVTGRWTNKDPIHFKGGDPNLYTYVLNNPINGIDPLGLMTAVVVNGTNSGNPFGHTAIATSGSGVYSFGNGTNLGSSLTDYLEREASKRNTAVIVIDTTPQQESAINNYLSGKSDDLPPWILGLIPDPTDTCATRTSAAMASAGLVDPHTIGPSFPTDVIAQAEFWRQRLGGTTYYIPKGGSIPSGLGVFNP